MKTTNDIFKGSDASLTEVVILPVGSHGAGSYSLPAGDLWTDYESVEFYGTYSSVPDKTTSTTILSKESIATNPTAFEVQVGAYGGTDLRLTITATGTNTFSIGSVVGVATVKQIKAYKKKYTTRNLSKTVSVNGGSNIVANQQYEIDIATELGSEYLGRILEVTAELYNNSGTGDAEYGEVGFVYRETSNDSFGVKGGVRGNKIIVTTGTQSLATSNPKLMGSVLNNTTTITSAPCRVTVQKVDEYLPATKSSGDITTIWTGSAGNGVTVDWSGTGYVLSQFDAIMLVGDIDSDSSMIHTSARMLSAVSLYVGTFDASNYMFVDDVTEISLVANITGAHTFTGVYGINYN